MAVSGWFEESGPMHGLVARPALARSRNAVAACMMASSVASARGISAVMPSLAEDDDPVRDGQQLGQLARGHDDRPALGGQLADQFVDLGLGADVDAAGGLVEQEDLGLDQEPAGEDALLLVAAREAGDRNVAAGRLDRQLLDRPGHGTALGARVDRAGPMVSSGRRRIVMFSATVMRSKRPRVLRSSVTMAIPALIASSGWVNRTGRPSSRIVPVG